jgi:hypothetical protein
MSRALFLLVLCAAVVGAADEDPIQKKLDAAKAAYGKEQDKFDRGLIAWFDQQEDAARKAGNKKLVDQLRDERKAFADRGEFPPNTPKTLLAPLAAARKAREASFQQAIKEYTKAKLDGPAGLVEEELQLFRFSATYLGRTLGSSPATIVNRNSEKVTAVSGASKDDGAEVLQWHADGGPDKVWVLVPTEDDYLYIRNENSKLLLGKLVKNESMVIITKKGNAETARHQQWKLIPVKDQPNYYLVQNRANGKYLSVENGSKDVAKVTLWTLNGATGSADQHWKFEKVEK